MLLEEHFGSATLLKLQSKFSFYCVVYALFGCMVVISRLLVKSTIDEKV